MVAAPVKKQQLAFEIEEVSPGLVTRPEYLEAFRRAAMVMRAELVWATPEWCAEVLKKSKLRNRKVSAANLTKILEAIFEGRYQIVRTILFDEKCNLLDGQHLMHAVIKTGISVPVICIYGIETEAFTKIDTGKTRNAADVLSIEGEDGTSNISAALSWLWREETGRLISGKGQGVPTDAVADVLNRHPNIRGAVKWAHSNTTGLVGPAIVAWLKYRMGQFDAALAEAFFLKIIRGTGIVDGSHEHLLRRRLENMLGKNDHEARLERAALIVKTWNRIRASEPPRKVLVWNKDTDGFPALA